MIYLAQKPLHITLNKETPTPRQAQVVTQNRVKALVNERLNCGIQRHQAHLVHALTK